MRVCVRGREGFCVEGTACANALSMVSLRSTWSVDSQGSVSQDRDSEVRTVSWNRSARP